MPPRRKKPDDTDHTERKRKILEIIHQELLPILHSLSFHGSLLSRLVNPLDNGAATTATADAAAADWINDSPNLLFYGSRGFPLEYMAYGLFPEFYQWNKQECQWLEKITYFDYQGHLLEFQCGHPDFIKQLGLLNEFLKHILTTRCMYQSKYIVLIRDMDIIAQSDTHYAFRVLLERYSNNVLFIATTHHLSKIEAPLKSRFMLLRIPQPTPDELMNIGGIPCRTLIEAMLYKTDPTFQPISIHPLPELSLEPDAIRQMAYRSFQSGQTFPEFCFHLLQSHLQHSKDVKDVKTTYWLLNAFAAMDGMRANLVGGNGGTGTGFGSGGSSGSGSTGSTGSGSSGRDPIYFERALWLSYHVNTLSK